MAIVLLHVDPAVIARVQCELCDFPILGVRFAMISDPRYELLIAQKTLVETWIHCIAGQRPSPGVHTPAALQSLSVAPLQRRCRGVGRFALIWDEKSEPCHRRVVDDVLVVTDTDEPETLVDTVT
jgi:hypothetical protein